MFLLIVLFIKNFVFRGDYYYLRIGIGYDLLSYIMILLRLFICVLIILASNKIYFSDRFKILFLFNLLILLMVLFLTFSIINLILFYLFFELSMLPVLLIIMG